MILSFSLVIFILIIIHSNSAISIVSACHPTSRWHCERPVCVEECQSVCKPPVCIVNCTNPSTHVDRRFPECATWCNSTLNQCELQECPICETICNELPQYLRDYGCRIECEEPECGWICRKPSICEPPICELVYQEPACVASFAMEGGEHHHHNSSKRTATISDFDLILLLFVLYLFV